MLFVVLFCSQYFCCCVHFHQFLLQAYEHENLSQCYNLKLYIVFAYFLVQTNIIFVSTDCSFVKMTSHCLNSNLVLNLWAIVVLKFVIMLIANFSSLKILLTCFFVSSTSSYLCFLWFGLYFVVISSKFLWSNPFSISFSFNHNIPSSSTIVSIPFLSHVFCLYQPFLYNVFHRSFRVFLFRFSFHYILLIHYLLKQTHYG